MGRTGLERQGVYLMAQTQLVKNAADLAEAHDLTKPLTAADLRGFDLKELETVKKILVKRALEIVSEINFLEARDDFSRTQAKNSFFNHRTEDENGDVLFSYTCEPKFAGSNLFVPGEWFAEKILELEVLRELKISNAESFEDRAAAKIIGQLCG